MPLVEWSAGTGENGSEGTVSSEIGSEAFLVMKHEETHPSESLGEKCFPVVKGPLVKLPRVCVGITWKGVVESTISSSFWIRFEAHYIQARRQNVDQEWAISSSLWIGYEAN